jgi:glucosamine-6-phosphate deaminase
MNVFMAPSPEALGEQAASDAAHAITEAIAQHGKARIIVATGASQFATLRHLVAMPMDWSRVELFHLDEYLGLSPDHPASFRRYLHERILDVVPVGTAHLIDPDRGNTIDEVLADLTQAIRQKPIDVALIGIGENGHIAFNDPPADFETREAYRIVDLDDACKQQQVGEGWFASVDDVPDQAISMTVYQILQSHTIICSVPHAVKAEAVKKTLTQEPTPWVPATALKRHANATLYVDRASSATIPQDVLATLQRK